MSKKRRVLAFSAAGLLAASSCLHAQSLLPSPRWSQALPAGPDGRVKITEAYARMIIRDAYFWALPIVNMHNRRSALRQVTDFVKAGPVPSAPPNRIAMLIDYIAAEERIVACPNQDVVYGAGFLALEETLVVVQVPDFGDRFWVYQIVNGRTDSFATIGKIYGTTPGFVTFPVHGSSNGAPARLRSERRL